jgi:hypothetical protein
LLGAFHDFAKFGQLRSITDFRSAENWQRAEAIMGFYPSQFAGGAHHSHANSGHAPNSRGNAGGGKGRQIPWDRDWLQSKGYEHPVKAFTCQKCGQYGYNQGHCPCKDGYTPAASSKKKESSSNKRPRTETTTGTPE